MYRDTERKLPCYALDDKAGCSAAPSREDGHLPGIAAGSGNYDKNATAWGAYTTDTDFSQV